MGSRRKSDRDPDVLREIKDLTDGLIEIGIEPIPGTIERFETYLEVLRSFRERVHLLSHKDYERVSRRHFLTSLVAYPYVKDRECICDVGAGAGFPSIPLEILVPGMDLVLFESNRKKADFLRHLVERLGLGRVHVVNERAESHTGKGFDVVLLRAVGKIDKLMKIVNALVLPEGKAIFFKAQDVVAELKRAGPAMKKYGFTAEIVQMLTPVEKAPMTLVVMRRVPRTGEPENPSSRWSSGR